MPWPTMPEIIVYRDTNFQGDSWLTSLPPGWGWNYVGEDPMTVFHQLLSFLYVDVF